MCCILSLGLCEAKSRRSENIELTLVIDDTIELLFLSSLGHTFVAELLLMDFPIVPRTWNPALIPRE